MPWRGCPTGKVLSCAARALRPTVAGTKTDVLLAVKQSQYMNVECPDSRLQDAVFGALERLQYQRVLRQLRRCCA